MTIISPIDRLVAEQEIERLLLDYALRNDEGDWPRLAHLFTETGQFVRPAGGDPVVGRGAIEAAYAARPPRRTRHVITNIMVDLLSMDEARCHSTMQLFAAPPGSDVAVSPVLLGGFRDRVVRTDVGWRFAERLGFVDFKVNVA